MRVQNITTEVSKILKTTEHGYTTLKVITSDGRRFTLINFLDGKDEGEERAWNLSMLWREIPASKETLDSFIKEYNLLDVLQRIGGNTGVGIYPLDTKDSNGIHVPYIKMFPGGRSYEIKDSSRSCMIPNTQRWYLSEELDERS